MQKLWMEGVRLSRMMLERKERLRDEHIAQLFLLAAVISSICCALFQSQGYGHRIFCAVVQKLGDRRRKSVGELHCIPRPW